MLTTDQTQHLHTTLWVKLMHTPYMHTTDHSMAAPAATCMWMVYMDDLTYSKEHTLQAPMLLSRCINVVWFSRLIPGPPSTAPSASTADMVIVLCAFNSAACHHANTAVSNMPNGLSNGTTAEQQRVW